MLGLIEDLEGHHGKHLTDDARAYYTAELVSVGSPFAIVKRAIEAWKRAGPLHTFPTLVQLRVHLDNERVRRYVQRKSSENPHPLSRPDGPAYAKDAWRLVRRAMKMGNVELAQAFEEMDKKWPGRGWNTAGVCECGQSIVQHAEGRTKPALDGTCSGFHRA